MNKTLLALIQFINAHEPEIHYNEFKNNKIVMFIQQYHASDFLGIIDHIDDEGYEMTWKGSYLAVELNGFIEYECETEVDDFVVIANIEERAQ